MSQLRVNTITDAGGTGSTYAPGHVVQVVQTLKSDQFVAGVAAGGILTVTGLSATITPKSANSKILVSYDISGSAVNGFSVILRRGGTPISLGDTLGSRTRVTSGGLSVANRRIATANAMILDSPNTTSAVTYDIQIHNVDSGGVTMYINLSDSDINDATGARAASRITLMEVAG
jgi:hypothetical protein